MTHKNTICLWFDGTALEAANFYARTFPDSTVEAVHKAPGDHPSRPCGGQARIRGDDGHGENRYRGYRGGAQRVMKS